MIGRCGLAAALLLAAVPASAQDNVAVPESAPPATENIGPRELSNFSLSGTVTRQSEEQPSAQPSAPARQQAPRVAAPAGSDSAPATRTAETSPVRSAPRNQLTLGPGSVTPAPRQADRPAAAAATAALPAPISAAPLEAPSGFSPLPWIAALLLLGAGAVVYFGMQRRGQRYARAGGVEQHFEAAPAARPAPQPAKAPVPAPLVRRAEPQPGPGPGARTGTVTASLRAGPASAAPPGVVTSSLRPWIELDLEPSQAVLTDDHAAIAFDVTLFNSGSAPARDVAIEACLINAGDQQDVQLSKFFKGEADVPDKIPAVAPMARITLKSAVRLPRNAVHEYEVEGRKLFMPMVAVSSRYRWSSGEGQSAAGFLVGRVANDSSRLGPLRLDQGTRGWKGLAARRYEKGIRR